MNPPRLTVIIPTFNRPKIAERAVQSALSQTHRFQEIILVDDGSSEDYVSDLRGLDPAIIVIRLDKNQGPSGARNAGLRMAKSEIVAFLDDDDEYHPSYLESVASAFAVAPSDVGLCWTGVQLVKARAPMPLRYQTRDFALRIKDRRSLVRCFLSIGLGHGVAVRRECFARVGGFATDLRLVEDTEWFLRFLSHGYLPMAVPGVHVTVHCHEGTRLTNTERDAARLQECESVLRAMDPFLRDNPDIRDLLSYDIGLSGRTDWP